MMAIVRQGSFVVSLLAVLVVACGPVGSTPELSGSPPSSATSNPTRSAEQSPPATSPAEASPFGVAVFPEPDDCIHPEGGYRVAYPDSWYSNAAVPLLDAAGQPTGVGIPACEYFAPTDFSIQYGTEIPSDIAIFLRIEDLPEGTGWNYGPYPGLRIVSDLDAAVDGEPARIQEIEFLEQSLAFAPGDRYTEYVVEMSENRYLTAQTYSQLGYNASRQVLDQMMQTLRFISP
jgi:hypothetical protein